jgi:hypothetical protein
MQVIIDALSDILDLEIPSHLNEAVELIMSFGEDPELAAPEGEMNPDLAKALSQVWAFEGAKEAVEVSHEFQLNDSASYYFDNIPRLAQPGYLPSDQDILRSRVKSVGIAETMLEINGMRLRLVDVGGQRSERRKWQGCFEDVNVLLFLISVSFPSSLSNNLSRSRSTDCFAYLCHRSPSTINSYTKTRQSLASRKRQRSGQVSQTLAGSLARMSFSSSTRSISSSRCGPLHPFSSPTVCR